VGGIALPPGSRIRLVAGEIERLAFDSRFDVALMFDVLEHLARPVDALRRVFGLLNDDGVLVGTVPEWDSPWRRLFPSHWGGLQIPRHQTFFTAGRLEQTLRDAGFEQVRIGRSFDPGDLSVTLCNWISDRLGLTTRPREAWFYLPVTVLAAPLALLGAACLGKPGALTFTARRAAPAPGGRAGGAGTANPGP
jgi:SAM-dependent methyltransferase